MKQYHRIIKFQQGAWLKTWIDFNAEKRKEAKRDFKKDIFRLLNNAVFGMTMENLRNHMDFELVTMGPKRYAFQKLWDAKFE